MEFLQAAHESRVSLLYMFRGFFHTKPEKADKWIAATPFEERSQIDTNREQLVLKLNV